MEQYIVKSPFCKEKREFSIPPLLYLMNISSYIGPQILCNLNTETFYSLLQAFPELEDGNTEIHLQNLGKIWSGCHEHMRGTFFALYKEYLKTLIILNVEIWRNEYHNEEKYAGEFWRDDGLLQLVRERENSESFKRNYDARETRVEILKRRKKFLRERLRIENKHLTDLKKSLKELVDKRNQSVGYEKHEFLLKTFHKQSSSFWLNVTFNLPSGMLHEFSQYYMKIIIHSPEKDSQVRINKTDNYYYYFFPSLKKR